MINPNFRELSYDLLNDTEKKMFKMNANKLPDRKYIRKDAKGNLILKKKFPIKKTKHHAYLVDSVSPDKKLANVVDIESYKKYNLDEEIEEDYEKEKEEKLEESNVVTTHGCCIAF